MHVVTQGLVLREVSYKESDKIMTVLTRVGGKRTVKAKGCRRKGSELAAAAQLLVWSDMTLFEYKDFWSLDEASSLEQFWHVKSDLDLLALGSYFAEVMEAVAEEGRSDEGLLSLILNSLYALDKLRKPLALVKAAYELKLMSLAGYEPMLEDCTACGAVDPELAQLNLSAGVLHCTACKGGVGGGISKSVLPQTLAAMRHVIYGDPKRLFSFPIDREGLICMGDVCETYLLTQLERGFRTLDFYKSLTPTGS